jgi:hypothetical protein
LEQHSTARCVNCIAIHAGKYTERTPADVNSGHNIVARARTIFVFRSKRADRVKMLAAARHRTDIVENQ